MAMNSDLLLKLHEVIIYLFRMSVALKMPWKRPFKQLNKRKTKLQRRESQQGKLQRHQTLWLKNYLELQAIDTD
jgi:hypothetical protein